jgi:hypothetical protein
MTDERLEREPGARAGSSEGRVLAILESLLRMHDAADDVALHAAASAALSALTGTPPAALRIMHAGLATRRPQDPLGPSVDLMLERAIREGIPLIDPETPRGIAFPIGRGQRAGAVYVVHPASALATGEAFDILRLGVAHIWSASANLRQRQASASSPFGVDAVPGTMSLRDAKFEFERRLLQVRLDGVRGNVASAARSLDMDRGQLSRLMKKHSLDRASFKPQVPGPAPAKGLETGGGSA